VAAALQHGGQEALPTMRHALVLLAMIVLLPAVAVAAEAPDPNGDARVAQVPTSPGARGPSGPRDQGRDATSAAEDSGTAWVESMTGWRPPDPTGTRFFKPAVSGGTGPTL
jgi:hypothetical protein